MHTFSLAIPPKPLWITTPVPKIAPAMGHYAALNLDTENGDESTRTGTNDSGFEEWKQHMHQSPSSKGTIILDGNIYVHESHNSICSW